MIQLGGVVRPKMVSCTANNWVLTLSVLDEDVALALKNELINAAGKGNGKMYALALVELDDNEHIVEAPKKKANQPKPYGKAAQLLRYELDGRFLSTIRNPAFCEVFGSDVKYQAWCRTQVCAHTGQMGSDCDSIVFAHVRRSATSGTGYKAPFMGIPLLNSVHLQQHHQGEATLFGSKDWMDKQRDDHVSRWMASFFGEESLGYVDPLLMLQHCEKKGAAHLLPANYRAMAK